MRLKVNQIDHQIGHLNGPARGACLGYIGQLQSNSRSFPPLDPPRSSNPSPLYPPLSSVIPPSILKTANPHHTLYPVMVSPSLLVSRSMSLFPALVHTPSSDSGDESASIISSQGTHFLFLYLFYSYSSVSFVTGTCSSLASSLSASIDSQPSSSSILSCCPTTRANEHLAVMLPKQHWKVRDPLLSVISELANISLTSIIVHSPTPRPHVVIDLAAVSVSPFGSVSM